MFDFVFAVNLNPPEAISFNFRSSALECVCGTRRFLHTAVFDREFDLAFFAFETVKASTFGLPFMPVGRDVALVFTLSSSLLPPLKRFRAALSVFRVGEDVFIRFSFYENEKKFGYSFLFFFFVALPKRAR